MTGAVFNDDRTYRYYLARALDPMAVPIKAHPAVTVCTFIMLNPSTADETQNDPTIRRCIRFAQSWGFNWLDIVNLNPFRSPDPRHMSAHELSDDVVLMNIKHVSLAALTSELTVAAWGAVPIDKVPGAAQVLRELAFVDARLWALGLTKEGMPRHPLYMRKEIRRDDLVPFTLEDWA